MVEPNEALLPEPEAADEEFLDQEVENSEPLDITADERRLVTQPFDLSVSSLVDDIDSSRLLLELVYQREYIWDDAKASRLIESLLLNVPIPVVYMAENADGTQEVVDGQQRLRSIWRFVSDHAAESGTQLTLRGLPVLTEANGLTFKQLSSRDQRRVLNRTVRCIVITEDSHPDIKFDVFERLNTGSVKLTDQELRNSIYRGPFNEALKQAATYAPFQEILDGQLGARMADVELVLRFLALADRLTAYKPPLRQFLNEYMRAHREDVNQAEELFDAFRATTDSVKAVFDTDAFRGRGGRQINKALFDTTMLAFFLSDTEELTNRAGEVRVAFDDLLADPDFDVLIGRATADRLRMFGRIAAFSEKLEVLGFGTRFRDVLPPDRVA